MASRRVAVSRALSPASIRMRVAPVPMNVQLPELLVARTQTFRMDTSARGSTNEGNRVRATGGTAWLRAAGTRQAVNVMPAKLTTLASSMFHWP